MNLHALLVGIDAYDGGGSLNGCVNDVDAIQHILLERIGVAPERIRRLVSPRAGTQHPSSIPDQAPTLANIWTELERLAGEEIAPTDRVFIFYSGHGTQLMLQDDAGHRFGREALLPKDKVRGLETVFLPDWQLNAAIARICARCYSATVILDCCSSAGATRDMGRTDIDTGTIRFWPTAETLTKAEAHGADAGLSGLAENLLAYAEKCQVIAACRADERAKEVEENGTTMGHLTRSLCNELLAFADSDLKELCWGRIWRRVEANVIQKNPGQHPWISDGFARRIFGGDTGVVSDVGFAVVKQGDAYVIDAGTLAGVTEGAVIGVYGPEPNPFPELNSAKDRAVRIGELRVASAELAASQAIPLSAWELPPAARGRLIQPGADVALRVALQPPTLALRRELGASSFVRLVDEHDDADIKLVQVDNGWALTDDIHGFRDDEPRFPVIPSQAGAAPAMVEHYYRYSAPLRLANSCRDLPRMLQIAVLNCNGVELTPENGQTIALPEVTGSDRVRYEAAEGDLVCVSVANQSNRNLYVTLIDVAPSGRVFLLGESNLPSRTRFRFWLEAVIGQPFRASVPQGQRLGVDRLVAIGATRAEFSLSHLASYKSFDEILQEVALGRTSRDLGGPKDTSTAEQYTSTVAALWVVKK